MNEAVVTILLVDDAKIDTKALRRSFEALKFDNPVTEARSGIEALALLRGENGYDRVPWPLLILLDLDMPGMGGFELLEELRHDPGLSCAPVFVMSGSEDPKDRKRAYDMNITGFIHKSGPGRSFLTVVKMLQGYVRVTEFPERPTREGSRANCPPSHMEAFR